MIITKHKSRMKGHPDFYCGRTDGAAFFGQSMREVIRKEAEWLLKNQPVGESRPATKTHLRLVSSNDNRRGA